MLIDWLFRKKIERRAQTHIAALLDRYSENRRCLRAGIAAYSNVDIANLGEVPTLERQHTRFVRAYAKAIQEIRNVDEQPTGGDSHNDIRDNGPGPTGESDRGRLLAPEKAEADRPDST